MADETGLIENLNLCKLLDVKPDTWRKRVAAGYAPLPFTRQGSRTYYRRSDVKSYLDTGLWPAHMQFRGRPKPEAPAAP